ncbi:MAG: hypothetical protein QG622_2941 [Actinomycetota bacterium]|nr:hypothetical protein [Actinomycetota bacterium]
MTTVAPPNRTVWRRTLVVVAAGLFGLAAVAPALGGSVGPATGATGSTAAPAAPWSEASLSPAIRGTEGLLPGGPGAPVTIEPDGGPTVLESLAAPAFPGGPPVTVTPDGSRLPRECPALAWRATVVRRPSLERETLPAVEISLSTTAPSGCQGYDRPLPLVVLGPGGESLRAITSVPITVAVLATPGISVRGEDGQVAVLPIAPTSGPVPAEYTIDVREAGGEWIPRRTTPAPAVCLLPPAAGTETVAYRVTARLREWSRSSAPVRYPTRATASAPI